MGGIITTLIVAVCGIFASQGFWTWLSTKRSKKSGLEAKIDAVDTKVTSLGEDVNTLRNIISQDQAITSRARILNFENDLCNNRKLTKETFDCIMDDIDRYEKYTAYHSDFKNGKTVLTVEHIKSVYAEKLKQQAFD